MTVGNGNSSYRNWGEKEEVLRSLGVDIHVERIKCLSDHFAMLNRQLDLRVWKLAGKV